jgi:pyrroline-5-carboxylate reductase
MPNGAAPVGASYTPWVGQGLAAGDAALVARILSAMGGQDAVQDEAQLDYLAALSGSGSAYPALMAQAMLRDALARGLPEAVAMAAVEAVVCGSAPFLAGKMGELDVLLNTYRGYKGVTAAGLDAAEAGLHQAMTDALAAASAKAQTLGQ